MSKLVPPHGGKGLVCCLLEGKALEDEKKKAAGLKQIEISSRAKGDLIMMGIGGFSPLNGFMKKADWKWSQWSLLAGGWLIVTFILFYLSERFKDIDAVLYPSVFLLILSMLLGPGLIAGMLPPQDP